MFEEYFDKGVLDTNNWLVSTWGAPQGGTFSAASVSTSKGMLGLRLTQSLSGRTVVSIGGEIMYKSLCHYGTYTWIMRASSTATEPTKAGQSCSGSISGLFPYLQQSQTELDFEVEGCRPNTLWMVNWTSEASKTVASLTTKTPLSDTFNTYKMVWTPSEVTYYLNDRQAAVINTNVPSKPAYPIINHWGTNNANWGGTATLRSTRWMWVKYFSYQPA